MTIVRRSVAFKVTDAIPAGVRSAYFAKVARQTRDDAIASGQAAPSFRTYVDGREGVSEDGVKPDGVIVYRFSALGVATMFALTFCIGRSPVREGGYRSAWIVAVDGAIFSGDPRDIPPGAEVIITNAAPYHRKIDSGHMQTSGRGIIEAARQAVMRKYPTLAVARQFVDLPGAYILLGSKPRAGRKVRSGRRKGDAMTYPAVVLMERT